MNVTTCEFEELCQLYRDAKQESALDMVLSQVPYGLKTYRVMEDDSPNSDSYLVIAIAFHPRSKRKVDLVVAGFATDVGLEKISPLFEAYLISVLNDYPKITFDLVNFPCLSKEPDKDPQLRPYLDKRQPGYRPPACMLVGSSTQGLMRMQIAHEAKTFRLMHTQ